MDHGDVTLVTSAAGPDITFRFDRPLPGNFCSTTTALFHTSGVIPSADVRVVQAIFREPQCQPTIVHETGHAIGFLDHTAAGDPMDPDEGDGIITAPVSTLIWNLYSLPPGTLIGSAQMTGEVRRGSGG